MGYIRVIPAKVCGIKPPLFFMHLKAKGGPGTLPVISSRR